MSNKNTKHNYTSELEIKSLLIRIKNKRAGLGTGLLNARISKYIKWHTKISEIKNFSGDSAKLTKVRRNLRDVIVRLSEQTSVDHAGHERFGAIVLLMIERILTRVNFSRYSYTDDFYSDAIHKIFKYLDNFDHKTISSRTGQPYNAFAYVSRIIHNSIVFIIKQKKKELQNLRSYAELKCAESGIEFLENKEFVRETEFQEPEKIFEKQKFFLDCVVPGELVVMLESLVESWKLTGNTQTVVEYPESYRISSEEFLKIKNFMCSGMYIVRRTSV